VEPVIHEDDVDDEWELESGSEEEARWVEMMLEKASTIKLNSYTTEEERRVVDEWSREHETASQAMEVVLDSKFAEFHARMKELVVMGRAEVLIFSAEGGIGGCGC